MFPVSTNPISEAQSTDSEIPVMDPTELMTILSPPHPPLDFRRRSYSCDRHPHAQFTGVCPVCVCESLEVIGTPSFAAASSPRKPPWTYSTAVATKAIRKPSFISGSGQNGKPPTSSFSSFSSVLGRSKSLSSRNEVLSRAFQTRRKSCDVRGRRTLVSLFSEEDERNPRQEASWCGDGAVFDFKVEEEVEVGFGSDPVSIPETVIRESIHEIREEEDEAEPTREVELKPMKQRIDFNSQDGKSSGRHLKDFPGSFGFAASIFNKKLRLWREKQKLKRRRNEGVSVALPEEHCIRRQFRETPSEIQNHGFGRRSTDANPRCRISVDPAKMQFGDRR